MTATSAVNLDSGTFPYKLPPVFKPYLEQFADEPVKSAQRLELFLKRRGNDAIGYFLLGWMYLRLGEREGALKLAQMAASFAPGTVRLSIAPYLFSHPAFTQAPIVGNTLETAHNDAPMSLSLSDLDHLIELLSDAESSRISIDSSYNNNHDLSEATEETVGDIASPTLASILVSQEKWSDALAMYERLDKGTGVYQKEMSELRERLARR